jgi:hypothetical protein
MQRSIFGVLRNIFKITFGGIQGSQNIQLEERQYAAHSFTTFFFATIGR